MRRNWAGNLEYTARQLHRPETLEQLAEILVRAECIRVLGSRHSFNGIADAAEQVTLEGLPEEIRVDPDAGTVSCSAWITYGRLAEVLGEHGLALANLASLPHISVAGAIATATHGSGSGNGNLATSVAAMRIMTSAGELVTCSRGETDFDGAVVGLGALGAVVDVRLDVQPAYDVRQHVFEELSWSSLAEHFDEIMGGGYSVSAFSRWGETVEQVWIKSRTDDERAGEHAADASLYGARPAVRDRHPIIGLDPVHATPQRGVPGRWSDRLPHFRMGFTPSSGEELQSEYLMPRRHAGDAIAAMLTISDIVHPLIQVAEIRTVAADRLWLSPAYDEDVVAFHFTWVPDAVAVAAALRHVERVLRPFTPRPHWGKLFGLQAGELAPLYPRLDDFRALQARWDPRGALHNAWLARVIDESAAPSRS